MYKNKKILVVGYGKSGKSMLKTLYDQGAELSLYDAQVLEKDRVENELDIKLQGVYHELPAMSFDLGAVSPGVPLDVPVIRALQEADIPIQGEIEIAYQLLEGTFIGITGTNGKTTTTTLTYELFKAANLPAELTGNVGIPLISKVNHHGEMPIFVTELSSFQLETIDSYQAKIGAILNITPDHLNRHKTMEAYQAAKLRIFENMDEEGLMILNYDDPFLRAYGQGDERSFFFSSKEKLEKGIFIEEEEILLVYDHHRIPIIHLSELYIEGKHSYENAMAAVAIAYFAGVDLLAIRKGLKAFRGVAHRYQLLGRKQGRTFINDSKATNPDATIKGVDAVDRPTVLIAGGMDKGSDFTPLIKRFTPMIKAVVLFGETKHKFAVQAKEADYYDVYIVEDLEEAVEKAMSLTEKGDNILLSPACASWDMYESFEKRGEHFVALYEQLEA